MKARNGKPRDYRKAQICGALLDAGTKGNTAYGVARQVKMSVSPNLREMMNELAAAGVLDLRLEKMNNGVHKCVYTLTPARLRRLRQQGVISPSFHIAIWQHTALTSAADMFTSGHDDIPF